MEEIWFQLLFGSCPSEADRSIAPRRVSPMAPAGDRNCRWRHTDLKIFLHFLLMAILKSTAKFLEWYGSSTKYTGMHILNGRLSNSGFVILTTHIEEVARFWISEVWDLWKLWRLRQAPFASFLELVLCPLLWNEGLFDFHRFLSASDVMDWTQIPLVLRHRVGYQNVCFSGQTCPHMDFTWIDAVNALLVNANAALHSCKRSRTSGNEFDQRDTLPRISMSVSEPKPKIQAPEMTPKVDLHRFEAAWELERTRIFLLNDSGVKKLFTVLTSHPMLLEVPRLKLNEEKVRNSPAGYETKKKEEKREKGGEGLKESRATVSTLGLTDLALG